MKIRISSLQDGLNAWQEQVDPAAIQMTHTAFVEPITVALSVEKRPAKVHVTVNTHTVGHFECDRCCIPFARQVNGNSSVVFIKRESPLPDEESGDDMRSFYPGQDLLDISTELRDTLILALPMRNICRPDCKGLCVKCGADLNEESCLCHPKPED